MDPLPTYDPLDDPYCVVCDDELNIDNDSFLTCNNCHHRFHHQCVRNEYQIVGKLPDSDDTKAWYCPVCTKQLAGLKKFLNKALQRSPPSTSVAARTKEQVPTEVAPSTGLGLPQRPPRQFPLPSMEKTSAGKDPKHLAQKKRAHSGGQLTSLERGAPHPRLVSPDLQTKGTLIQQPSTKPEGMAKNSKSTKVPLYHSNIVVSGSGSDSESSLTADHSRDAIQLEDLLLELSADKANVVEQMRKFFDSSVSRLEKTYAKYTTNLTKKVQSLQKVVDELKLEVTELNSIKDRVAKVSADNRKLKKELKELKEGPGVDLVALNALKIDVQEQKKQLESSAHQLIVSEQYQRQNNLIVSGLPIALNLTSQDCLTLSVAIARSVGVQISKRDINKAHPLPSRSKTGPNFLIQFTNNEIKSKLMIAKAKSHRDLTSSQIAAEFTVNNTVFFNHHLTKHFNHVFFLTRQAKKDALLYSTRFHKGSIRIRRLQTDREVCIFTSADLDVFLRNLQTPAPAINEVSAIEVDEPAFGLFD
jgi:hypothetical protein